MRALLPAIAFLAIALAGCATPPAPPPDEDLTPDEIGQEEEKRFAELTQVVPSNYTFPRQELLEPVVLWFNDTIDSAANLALENPRDDGGMAMSLVRRTFDISAQLPPQQPAELHLKLYWYGNIGQSADMDIWTDLPGSAGSYDASTPQEYNWNVPVKRKVVNTVGVENMPALVGVEASNGKIAPGQVVNFVLEVSIQYARDVLAPHNAYAFQVPEGATGLVLRSEKLTGDEHLQADFMLISPGDELVSYQRYDDIAIPTESVFIPVREPGEYVFYAHRMVGGFLTLKADVPVPQREARILPLVEERTIDLQGNPLAPGVVGHELPIGTGLIGEPVDGQVISTPYSEGTQSAFTLDRFPLRVEGFFEGDAVAGDVEVRILNAKGLVFDHIRSLRLDTADGSVGWSGDHGVFRFSDPSLLGKGSYTVSMVVNGYTGSIGHMTLTYDRGAGAAASGGNPA